MKAKDKQPTLPSYIIKLDRLREMEEERRRLKKSFPCRQYAATFEYVRDPLEKVLLIKALYHAWLWANPENQ